MHRAFRTLALAIVLLGSPLPTATSTHGASAFAQGFDAKRAEANLREIQAGRKKFTDLTADEQSEVTVLIKVRTRAQERRRYREECREAFDRATASAEELASYSRRLLRCAESEDLSDDCSTEFRRVKRSYSDYESALSDLALCR